MTSSSPMIQVTGLHHRVGRFELGPLDFEVPEGSITALVGPNGAGKTTLLDLLFGLGRTQHGRIEIAGLVQPQADVAIKHRVGFVSPDLGFTTWGRIGSALDYVSGFYPGWSAERCESLLELFALDRGMKIAGLSLGERTRLALIVALARETDVLLLDEPTTGLDVAGRRNLFAELLNYIERPGRAVLISSHQLGDLERLADRVVVLGKGKLLAQAAMDELVERYEQWDITAGARPEGLPEGMRLIACEGERTRVMADLRAAGPGSFERGKVLARAPMTLEEVYLAMTGAAE